MTRRSEDLSVEEKVVIFFDICSSSTILEDLLATDNMKIFRNVLISIKSFLKTRASQDEFVLYKFIGDGWVLLFPPDVSGECIGELSHATICGLFQSISRAGNSGSSADSEGRWSNFRSR